nr:MAG TPA: hypothetical protein [Herelleviridae sp.]
MSLDVTTLALAKSYTNQHGGGGGQVQPDWNQNDSTAADYVKNRPFYTGAPVETVLVEESTVSFEDDGDIYMGVLESAFSATVGETYKVSWDGAVYESACVDFSGKAIIGNISLAGVGSDTGEPFIMIVNNGRGIMIGTADNSASHTFSISKSSVEVVKIDEKYLPDNLAIKSDVEVAQTTAETAQTTADSNKEMISNMFSSVATFTFDKQTSGRDTFVFNAFHYYKISDFNPAPENVISFKGTKENGDDFSIINIGNNCMKYGFFIVVAVAGNCSITFNDLHGKPVTMGFTAPSAGLYARYKKNNSDQTAGTGEFTLRVLTGSSYITGLLLKSSTANSTKKFRITVDDDYNVSATNISDSASKALATTEYVDNSVSNPLNITSAAVGQIAKITAVDDSGKPTAWEAVDMPSGGGSGGSGGVTTLHINVTAVNMETMKATFTADKTPAEMQQASANGPVWCVVTFAAGIMAEEAASFGIPPAWAGGVAAFGLLIEHTHEDGGNNKIVFAVEPALADKWNLNLSAFGS